MDLLRAIVLSVVLVIAAHTAVAIAGSHASGPIFTIEQSIESHALTGPADYCNSGAAGTHGTSQGECCAGISCGQAGVAAPLPISAPVWPLVAGPNMTPATRIDGRNIAPDTDPPKPLA